jgi:hypothetical protein
MREPSGDEIIFEPSGKVLMTLPLGPTVTEGTPLGTLNFGLPGFGKDGSLGISGDSSRSLSCPVFECGVGGGVATDSGVGCFFACSVGLGVSVFFGVLTSGVGVGLITTCCTGLPTDSAVATGLGAGDGVGSPNFTTASL